MPTPSHKYTNPNVIQLPKCHFIADTNPFAVLDGKP